MSEEICDEPEVTCPICGRIRDDGYCKNCWDETLMHLQDLASEHYKVNNCVRDDGGGDIITAEYIIEKAESLLSAVKELKDQYKRAGGGQ